MNLGQEAYNFGNSRNAGSMNGGFMNGGFTAQKMCNYSGTNSRANSVINSMKTSNNNNRNGGKKNNNRGKNNNDANRQLLTDSQLAELYQFLQGLEGLAHIELIIEKFNKHGVSAQILQNVINFEDLKDMNIPVGPRAVLRYHMTKNM